ncbi:NifU family protein [Gordonia rhizosphera]|uniref:Putative Rieske iron-sulfur protein n=1 Tax=Gordonia rhizosphera NBRC 16068 TaxID=1108045 RepID=K6WCR0_9ACTN|nr:NifU family protein [Gordonia rhizosphera]GAB91526.1 putative Rieske iron-sulfur protein [Gordonia rhizosphera NBRC 16068]
MTTQQERPTTPAAHDKQAPGMEDLARAVDDAAAKVADLPPEHRDVAEQLRGALDNLNKAALTTIVRALRDDDRGRELLFDIVDDPVVRLALMVHGIIRPDPLTAARQAVVAVEPMIGAHGGGVEVVRVDERVAYVRLSGACDGCSMSEQTLRDTVTEAIVSAVPAIDAVELVEPEPQTPAAFIPLGDITVRASDTGWIDAAAVGEIPRGELVARTLTDPYGASEDIIVVNLEGTLTAFLNVCAHQGLPLDDALIDEREGTLTCPWHALCYDATDGECMSLPGAALEQRPVRVDGDRVWVRLHG